MWNSTWSPLKRLMWLYRAKGGGGGTATTVTGTAPLTLANALAKAIKKLLQFGKVEQASTPTPSVPVDIVCNNGTLKMRHRSGLPSGYTLLDCVGGSGSQYVVTNTYLASTDVIECEFRNSATTGYGAIYGIYKTGESSALYGYQTYYGYDTDNNKVDTNVHVNTEWHASRHDFVNGTLTVDNTTVTFTPFEFVNSTKNAVLSRYFNGNYGYNWKGYIRKFKVTRGNEVICDLLPCENPNGVVGLYDIVAGAFYSPTGGDLLAGNVVNDYELGIVGTPEVLTLGEQTASAESLLAVGDYKDTQNITTGAVTRKVGVKVFDGTETFTKSSAYGKAFLINAAYVAWGADRTKEVLCTHFLGLPQKSSTQDDNTCFFNSTGHFYFRVEDNSDTDAFKAWLADQYAAGTPVIVLYVLAEATTESVAPQQLHTAAGSNIISVEANVSPIELEVEYIAS